MEVGTVSNTKPNRRLRDFAGLYDTSKESKCQEEMLKL